MYLSDLRAYFKVQLSNLKSDGGVLKLQKKISGLRQHNQR